MVVARFIPASLTNKRADGKGESGVERARLDTCCRVYGLDEFPIARLFTSVCDAFPSTPPLNSAFKDQ